MGSFDHRSGDAVFVDGAALYVEQIGNPDGPPVVFLHGGLGSIDDFAALLPLLGERHRFIGVDSRGHGRSTMGDGALTYGRLERDIVAILGHLGGGAVDLIGFSDGGIVGYRLAAHHPELVRSLTTIGADWELPEDGERRDRLGSVTPDSWRARFPGSEADYVALNPAADFERLVRATVAMWLGTIDGYPGDDVSLLGCPLTVIRGSEDALSGYDQALALVERVPGAALHEIEGGGHAVAATHPEATADIVLTALATSVSRD